MGVHRPWVSPRCQLSDDVPIKEPTEVEEASIDRKSTTQKKGNICIIELKKKVTFFPTE